MKSARHMAQQLWETCHEQSRGATIEGGGYCDDDRDVFIDAITEAIEAERARAGKLREALEYYADDENSTASRALAEYELGLSAK